MDRTLYQQFIGEYKSSDKIMAVALRNDDLIISVPGQAGFLLVPVRRTEFTLKKLPGYAVEFKADESGRFARAIVTQPSEVLTLQKTKVVERIMISGTL